MSFEPSPPEPAQPSSAAWDGLLPIDWRHPNRRQIFVAGLVAVPLLAIALGLAFSPHLDAHKPMRPATGEAMRIVLGETPNTPVSMARGASLQVLPPGATSPPPVQRPALAAAGARGDAVGLVPVAVETSNAPTSPPQTATAGFDCSGNLSRAEMMVCADPRLAAADRRMKRAWRDALASGASSDDLRREQRDWLADRDEAVGDGADAMLALYAQRTRDLRDDAARSDNTDDPRF